MSHFQCLASDRRRAELAMEVGMMKQFRRHALRREGHQYDLQPGLPLMLHCRNAIRVIRDQDDPLYGLGPGESGDVQTNAHVHALLLEVGLNVRICELVEADEHIDSFKASELQDSKPRHEKIFDS